MEQITKRQGIILGAILMLLAPISIWIGIYASNPIAGQRIMWFVITNIIDIRTPLKVIWKLLR
jgi:zinc transporter ZupT